MKKILYLFAWSFVLGTTSLFARDPIKIVTTLTDLAALAKEVGQEHVQVESLVRPTQDPHHIEVLPSYMMKLRKAELFLVVGMELDLWAASLRDGARNDRLIMVDCSQNIAKLEIPPPDADASQGDVHRAGNPHYWLDPENGRNIARTIHKELVKVAPELASTFSENLQSFEKRLDQRLLTWQKAMEPLKGSKLIFFHNSWPYFTHRFNLKAVAFVEPKPGIPPSPAHTALLLQLIKEQEIKVILIEPFYDRRVPELLSRQTGAKVMILPPSVGGAAEATDYLSLFDYQIKMLEQALTN